MAGPPPSAWPKDLLLQCRYDPVMVDLLFRTEVELEEGKFHTRIVNPRLLAPDGSHLINYVCRPTIELIEPKPSKKRKSTEDEGPTKIRKPACGRYIAQGSSPQTLPSWQRRFACFRHNWEIDQVNSCANIMWWMAFTCQVDRACVALKRYIEERDDMLGDLCQQLDIGYDEAKRRITSIMMGQSSHIDWTSYEWTLSRECSVIRDQALIHPAFEKERDKYYDEDFKEKELFSRLVLAKEREIMEVVMEELKEMGYGVSALIHDSVLVQRPEPLEKMNLALPNMEGVPADTVFQHIRELEAAVAHKCGLHMKFAQKSLRPTVEDVQLLLRLPRDCFTSHDAAFEAYLHCSAYIRHAREGIALYDSINNIWELDEERLLSGVMHKLFEPIAHRMTSKAAPNKKATHFLKDVNAAKNLLKSLQTVVPQDRNWKDRCLLKGRGYLCFRNGYYDFQQHAFVEGHCPEMEFLVGVRDEYRSATSEEFQMAYDFMRAPYSNTAVFNYYMIALARGLAGEVSAKQGYICIGPSNSGKSTFTGAVVHAFDGVVDSFDPSNLCNVGGDGDRAKNMGWIVPLEFKRVALGCEIDMYARGGKPQKINMIQWKVIVSGGLDEVPQRLLYNNAHSTKINTTFFVHANDVPPFSAVDQAVVNRTFVVAQDRKAMENPHGDKEFKMIPNGEVYVRTDEFKAGLRALLFAAYAKFLEVGHVPPPEVLMSTQDRVEMTNPMEQLSEIFEIWTEDVRRSFVNNAAAKAAGWCLQRQKLVDTIHSKQLGMSPAAVIAELKKHGHIEEVRHSTGKVFIGIRTKIGAEFAPGQRD